MFGYSILPLFSLIITCWLIFESLAIFPVLWKGTFTLCRQATQLTKIYFHIDLSIKDYYLKNIIWSKI